ncbi:chromosome transmission fidelity [Trichoderma arundinaceum]|uniref:Chromosome transmission fidelity n=1 Tax=Trichoderma arundinaceum TaxID=490622 RepID=A0A395NY94_TRIAR|nr:chromosome transmission fidelity [Trichoderma arundinaceum]
MPDSSTKQTEWYQRPRAWRAPTWSWASVLGPVQFLNFEGGVNALCEIEEAKCVAYQSDPTGELSSGHVLLRGHFMPTSIQYKQSGKESSKKPFELLQLDIMQGQVGNVWADYDSSLPGIEHIPPGALVQCFMLTTRPDSGSLVLLLLRETGYDEDKCCTIWERIGLIQLSRPPTIISEAKEYWFDIFKPRISEMTLAKII